MSSSLRAREILFAATDGGFVELKLLLQFGNLQDREKLPLAHVRAPIHIELLDVAGHLGVNVDFLKGLEFRGDLEGAGNILADGFDYGDARGVRWIVCANLRSRAAAAGKRGQQGDRPRRAQPAHTCSRTNRLLRFHKFTRI